jgi:hypothetical protein
MHTCSYLALNTETFLVLGMSGWQFETLSFCWLHSSRHRASETQSGRIGGKQQTGPKESGTGANDHRDEDSKSTGLKGNKGKEKPKSSKREIHSSQ